MADILVSIQTRSRPDILDKSLSMFYGKCSNANNFDMQLIIDNDQIELYKGVIDKYPQIIKIYVEHQEASWLNIYIAQLNYAKEHDYYFLWNICDDIIGLSNNWDASILATKNRFEDGLFALYTQTIAYGRNQHDYSVCYSDPIGTTFHECIPIITKKFSEFLAMFYQNQTEYIWGREVIISELIRILYVKYNEHRHVKSDVNYENITCSYTFNKMMYCMTELTNRNFDELYPIVDKIKEYIDSKK